jgi:hypothetical protein
MRWTLTRVETLLLVSCLALLLGALVAPALAQPPHAHDFADGRPLWGLPCALDVLSNLPFLVAGAIGLWWLQRVPPVALSPVHRGCAALFFVGLAATAVASGFYHWAPDDFGLAIDRSGMSVAFAGLLGLLAAVQVSDRAGRTLAIALLVLGPAAAWFCLPSGNVLPWALVQFGGMALVLALAFRAPRQDALQVRWVWVLFAYAVAKLFEVNDHALYEATGQLLSGHTLKHMVAALAAVPVIAAVAAQVHRQNGPAPVAASLARARRA